MLNSNNNDIHDDEIVMSRDAVLGPVDPQRGEYPAVSVVKVVSKKSHDEIDDKTLVLYCGEIYILRGVEDENYSNIQVENRVYEEICRMDC